MDRLSVTSRVRLGCTRILASLVLAVVVSSCRSLTPTPSPPAAHAVHAEGATAARPGLSLRVMIEVAGRNEIEEAALRITEEGRVRLPLLGKVNVADRSLSEIESLLAERYAEFFVRPRVTVDFADTSREGLAPWGSVTVLGRVRQPGRVPLPPTRDLTVSAAIQEAGGLSSSARTRAIRVTRPREDGSEQSFLVNLRAVGRRGHTDQDRVLRDGDVVYVPESIF